MSIQGTRATLDLRGREVVADASMLSVSPGDFVLVYAGLIAQVLTAEEAEETLRLLSQVEKPVSIVP